MLGRVIETQGGSDELTVLLAPGAHAQRVTFHLQQQRRVFDQHSEYVGSEHDNERLGGGESTATVVQPRRSANLCGELCVGNEALCNAGRHGGGMFQMGSHS